jgi:hypothetical protein
VVQIRFAGTSSAGAALDRVHGDVEPSIGRDHHGDETGEVIGR